MNITDLKVALPLIASMKRTAMLHGKHGEGKSQVIRQIFENMGKKVVDVRLGQMADAGDLIGLPQFMKDNSGQDYLKYVFPDFFPRQEDVVIFFDELNRAPKDILQGVFEMVFTQRCTTS
jgi:MoxR-like ATPase